MSLYRERLAWAAGLVDGEGCFTTAGKSKTGLIDITFSMAQKDSEVLWDFKGAVQVGSISWRDNSYPGGIYRFDAPGFRNVQYLAALLWFNLGTVKREQAYNVLDRWHTSRGHWRRINMPPVIITRKPKPKSKKPSLKNWHPEWEWKYSE